MTHGHIGFGCYPALHGNEEGDLAGAGDKNEVFYDNWYLHDDFELEEDDEKQDGRDLILCGSNKHSFYQNFNNTPFFSCLCEHSFNENVSRTRSEVLATRCHRGVKRLQAESRKHQQFYGNLRVR
jgi:hypothetical protein